MEDLWLSCLDGDRDDERRGRYKQFRGQQLPAYLHQNKGKTCRYQQVRLFMPIGTKKEGLLTAVEGARRALPSGASGPGAAFRRRGGNATYIRKDAE